HHCSACSFLEVTSSTQIYTLSLHDALPIFILPETSIISHLATGTSGLSNSVSSSSVLHAVNKLTVSIKNNNFFILIYFKIIQRRSEEHTSELQSRENLVCRLLLEKKNTIKR